MSKKQKEDQKTETVTTPSIADSVYDAANWGGWGHSLDEIIEGEAAAEVNTDWEEQQDSSLLGSQFPNFRTPTPKKA